MRNGSMRALSGSLLNIIIAGAAIAASGGLAACRGAAPGQRAIAGEPAWTATVRAGAPAPGGDARGAAVTSNILRQDYVGSKECEPCHSEIYAAWAALADAPHDAIARRRAHSRAVRRGGVSFQGRRRALRRARAARASFALASASAGTHLYRVTQASSAAATARTSRASRCPTTASARRLAGAPKAELILPVSYVFETPSVPPQGLLGDGGRAARACARAASGTRPASSATTPSPTSTSPGASCYGPGRARLPGRGRRSLAAAGAPVLVRDHRRRRRWRARSTRELAVLSAAAPRARRRRRRRAEARRSLLGVHARCAARFDAARTSSRSASAASRATAAAASTSTTARAAGLRAAQRVPARRARRARRGRGRRAPRRSTAPARAATRCCSRATRSPGRAAAPRRRRRPGRQLDHLGRGARLPARRLRAPDGVRDLPRSARRGSARRSSSALATPAGNGVCTRCHAQLRRARGAARARAPRSRGRGRRAASPATCRARTWASATRSRAITASARPPMPARVERDRPLECALCHADKSVGELVGDDGALVGQALRSRGAGGALRRRSGRERAARRPRARQAARAGGGDGGRSARRACGGGAGRRSRASS